MRSHLRLASRVDRLSADAARLEQRIRGRSESLARQFDRVLRVMESWAYVEGWHLTDRGRRLARTYHEADLLVTETIERGLLDGLDAASLAALVSGFTYETRGPGPAPAAWFPSPDVRARWDALDRLATELNNIEKEAGLPETRRPDPGFIAACYAWAMGGGLDDAIADEDLSGGDFVRNIKQLIDLLRQLTQVSERSVAQVAGDAADQLYRGVVAASSIVTTGA